MFKTFFAAAAVLLAGTGSAFAHISFETPSAPVGGAYKAVLRVPHGCAGSATIGLHIRIPEGVVGVKPMPKAGWTLKVVKGKYARPHQLHGAPRTEGVTEIVWSGGNLPDAFYDEFVFTTSLAADLEPGAMLYFPVVQTCETGAVRWIEIPAPGSTDDDYKNPAPGLTLLPAAADGDDE